MSYDLIKMGDENMITREKIEKVIDLINDSGVEWPVAEFCEDAIMKKFRALELRNQKPDYDINIFGYCARVNGKTKELIKCGGGD